MNNTSHLLAGAVICRGTSRRPLGLVLALLSHFLLDAVPHFEHLSMMVGLFGPGFPDWWRGLYVWFAVITTIGAVGVYWRFGWGKKGNPGRAIYIIVGGALGILPDILATQLSRDGFFYWVNLKAHWWDGYVYGNLARPTTGLVMMAVEWSLIAVLAWTLFRKARSTDDGPPS